MYKKIYTILVLLFICSIFTCDAKFRPHLGGPHMPHTNPALYHATRAKMPHHSSEGEFNDYTYDECCSCGCCEVGCDCGGGNKNIKTNCQESNQQSSVNRVNVAGYDPVEFGGYILIVIIGLIILILLFSCLTGCSKCEWND